MVLESILEVVNSSKHINIKYEKINLFCDELIEVKFSNWLEHAPFDLMSLSISQRINFVFILDSISFCYWSEPKWTVKYNNKTYDGTWALIASLGKAIENNIPITDFKFLAELDTKKFNEIFENSERMPLKQERLRILNELGNVITTKFDGKFENLIKLSNNDIFIFIKNLKENIPSFKDESFYKNKKIYFYKRAQLLISDMHTLFADIDDNFMFKNISSLTACADYKLPQILRKYNILEYDKHLSSIIDKKQEILKDSLEEIEIRANTIQAVEIIKQGLLNKGITVTSHQINDYLWLESQTKINQLYHRTVTTSY